jgi:hypothetical protein
VNAPLVFLFFFHFVFRVSPYGAFHSSIGVSCKVPTTHNHPQNEPTLGYPPTHRDGWMDEMDEMDGVWMDRKCFFHCIPVASSLTTVVKSYINQCWLVIEKILNDQIKV